MRNRLIIPAAAVAIAAVSIFGVTQVSAHGWGSTDMVTTLSEKLGVSEDKVQEAFDEIRTEHRSQMHTSLEERLTQAVADGKITDSQKTMILEKYKELQDAHEDVFTNLKDMTPEERRTEMDARRTEIRSWAEENGIDESYLFQGMGRGMHGGPWMK